MFLSLCVMVFGLLTSSSRSDTESARGSSAFRMLMVY